MPRLRAINMGEICKVIGKKNRYRDTRISLFSDYRIKETLGHFPDYPKELTTVWFLNAG